MRGWMIVTAMAGLFAGPLSGGASAAITIGQAPPPGVVTQSCGGSPGVLWQAGVAQGPDYRVPPGGGVITSFLHHAHPGPYASPGPSVSLSLAGDVSATEVNVLAHLPLQPLQPGRLNTFPVRVPVSGGERVGL